MSRRDPSGSTWWLRSTPSSFAPSRSIAAAAGEVEEVRAEFDCHATQLVERVAEHQQLGLAVDPAAPRRRHVPGVADLQPPVGRVDVHVARRADERAVEPAHHERQSVSGVCAASRVSTHCSAACAFGACGEPQATQFAVGGGRRDLRNMFAAKRFQRHPAVPGQRDRLDEAAHASGWPPPTMRQPSPTPTARTAAIATAAPR